MPQGHKSHLISAKIDRLIWNNTRNGLALSVFLASTTAIHAQSDAAPNEVTLSELSVTGNGPAVERAGGPVIGYRCSANHSIFDIDI